MQGGRKSVKFDASVKFDDIPVRDSTFASSFKDNASASTAAGNSKLITTL